MKQKSSTFRLLILGAILFTLGLCAEAPLHADEHRVGLGIHYWQTAKDLLAGDNLEEDGVSFLLSYQFQPKRGLLKYEIDLEYFDDGFSGSSQEAFAPTIYVVFGDMFYVAGGIGVTISSDLENEVSDPFYTGRLGYQFDVLPGLRIDLNANYRTNAFEELGDFDTEVITFGVIARLKL